jgi:hypothetical protein
MINVAYYLRLAESYGRLADQEERLARDIAEFEIESQQG